MSLARVPPLSPNSGMASRYPEKEAAVKARFELV